MDVLKGVVNNFPVVEKGLKSKEVKLNPVLNMALCLTFS